MNTTSIKYPDVPKHDSMYIEIPDTKQHLTPGCKVKLGRFKSDWWVLDFGWYSFGGNRPFCGWYLTSNDGLTVKPLQLPDLDDMYIVEY